MLKPLRIAVLNTHPIQYFAPLYAHLARTVPTLEVTALYCSDYSLRGAKDEGFAQTVSWDIDLLAGYKSVFLGEDAAKRIPRGFWSLVVPQIWRELRSGNYDVLWLHGYGYFACIIAFLAARSLGIPVLLRGETHLLLARGGWRRWFRDRLLGQFFKRIDGFLAIGSRNREYYRSMGVPDSRIHLVPYTVDNERFMQASDLSVEVRKDIRARFGIFDDTPIVLYASKLVERKHAHTLLQAIAAMQGKGTKVALCIVGSGPMQSGLQELKKELNLLHTNFVGFVNQSELPGIYAACDIFVLAAESEPWGLVVNEVMCAGLPVVVSDEAGCAADLVEDEVNGYQVRAGNQTDLISALSKLCASSTLRSQMGRASVARIRRWSYDECAAGLCDAISALHRRGLLLSSAATAKEQGS